MNLAFRFMFARVGHRHASKSSSPFRPSTSTIFNDARILLIYFRDRKFHFHVFGYGRGVSMTVFWRWLLIVWHSSQGSIVYFKKLMIEVLNVENTCVRQVTVFYSSIYPAAKWRKQRYYIYWQWPVSPSPRPSRCKVVPTLPQHPSPLGLYPRVAVQTWNFWRFHGARCVKCR